jgi:hypothetical protein
MTAERRPPLPLGPPAYDALEAFSRTVGEDRRRRRHR